MSVIVVKCTDQVLTFENTPIITSGGRGEDFVKFSFCTQWDGFVKTAVFWRTEHEPYHVLLDEDNTCAIPYEVLTKDGRFYFGVFGVNTSYERRTSEVLTYLVAKGAITEGTQPSDPTPEIYDKLLAEYAATQAKYNEAMSAMEQHTKDLQQTVEDCTRDMQQTVEDCTDNLNQAAQQNKEELNRKYDEAIQAMGDFTKDLQETVDKNAEELNDKYEQAINSSGYSREETINDATRNKYGVGGDAVPADIFDKIHGMIGGNTQMEIVSYQGTDTSGEDNPTSVTFSKAPSVIIMLGYRSVDSGWWHQSMDLDYDYIYMLPTSVIPTEYTRRFGFGSERNYDIYGKKSEDGRTFSWYSYHLSAGEGDAGDQCNSSSCEYYVLGLFNGGSEAGGDTGGSGGDGTGGGSGDSGSGGDSETTITFTIDGVGTYNCTSGMTWADWEATAVGKSVIYIDHDDLVWLESGERLADSYGTEQYAYYPISDCGIYMALQE